MKPIYILLILAITIFAGCNKIKPMPISFIQIPYGRMYQTILFMSWRIQQYGKMVYLFYRTEWNTVMYQKQNYVM